MKVIAIGDPHFRIDNVSEVDIFIEKMINLSQSEKPDLIVVLGDLLHTHERLHITPLNKACEFIEKLHSICPVIMLVGNHDMCFSGDTAIAGIDGFLLARDIKIGDLLKAPNNEVRKVLSTCKGSDYMYTIVQKNRQSYTVNQRHLLVLKCRTKIIDSFYNNYAVSYVKNLEFITKFFDDRDSALEFYNNLGEEYRILELTAEQYYYLDINIKKNIKGIDDKGLEIDIEIAPTMKQDYYGFVVDGDNKFLLADGTIVHNCNNQQYLSENHWMNVFKKWPNVTVIDKTYLLNFNDYRFVFCPYTPPGRFVEALNTIGDEWKYADCIFAHQEFYGCKMGAIVSVEGDKWDESYPKVVSGHIHSRQSIGENIYYCGSSMQHAFGESDKNIIPILEWKYPNSDYILKEIDLQLPRKKIIYTDVDNIEKFDDSKQQLDKVKLSVTGGYDDFKALKKTKKYKDLVKKGVKIVFKQKKIEKNSDIVDSSDFSENLNQLIMKEKNPYLYETYELIVNNKEVSHQDILYLD